jgi:hypothetical protein
LALPPIPVAELPTRARILEENPQAAPADIEEYERLLSERFATDPDQAASPEAAAEIDWRESRLAELYRKLFPQRHDALSRTPSKTW